MDYFVWLSFYIQRLDRNEHFGFRMIRHSRKQIKKGGGKKKIESKIGSSEIRKKGDRIEKGVSKREIK